MSKIKVSFGLTLMFVDFVVNLLKDIYSVYFYRKTYGYIFKVENFSKLELIYVVALAF